MHTLAELCDFIGLPQAGLKSPYGTAQSALELAGLLVTTLDKPARWSLAALIDAVQQLPPITLDVSLVGPQQGDTPFVTTIRISPNAGAAWSTYVFYVPPGGGRIGGGDENLRGQGRDFVTSSLDGGDWKIRVVRTGLAHTGGPVELVREVAVRVRAQEPDPPPDPPNPPDPPVPANQATCLVSYARYEGDTREVVRVYGGGFVPGETVGIFVDQAADPSPFAEVQGLGNYSAETSLFRHSPKSPHTFRAVGLTSKLASATVTYSA
jgi:hypothetical protein